MMGRALRTPEKEEQFLAVLAEGYSVKRAARTIGAGRRTVYDWRDADEDFRRRWDEAIEEGTDALEDIALERAKRDSDTLLIFQLKARRPEKYRDRSDLNVNGNIAVTVVEHKIGEVIEGKAEEVLTITDATEP